MLLQVPAAVEVSRAEVAGIRPLSGVDDDVAGELRAALLVFAADVADEGLLWARSVSVHHLPVPLQVAVTAEAAAAEVTGKGAHIAVDQGVARQQGAEAEHPATDGAWEGTQRGSAPPACGGRRLSSSDPQVYTGVVLLQAGGALEAAQADGAAVWLVACVGLSVSVQQHLGLQALPADAAGEGSVEPRAHLAVAEVGVHQDLVALQLVLAGELAAADVTEVRPLTRVRLEVNDELRAAPELFATRVTEQRGGLGRVGAAGLMHHLPVVLQVIDPHVGFGAEGATMWLHARVDHLVRLQAGPAAERLPTDGAEPRG